MTDTTNPSPAEKLEALLQRYQVSPTQGFVPETAPPDQLPPAFQAWEALAQRLPQLASANLRPAIEQLPPWPEAPLPSPAVQERAFLLLCLLGQAYLHADAATPTVLPARLARPWQLLADQLGRLPVVNHASLVLQNWGQPDPGLPFTPENLAPRFTFTGADDESWFYLVTLMVEYRGAAAVYHAAGAVLTAQTRQYDTALQHLKALPAALTRTQAELQRMYERCDPHFFYHRLRPWIGGVNGVRYAGCMPAEPRSYAGGSAAQSALLQSLDAALGVSHQTQFLQAMRAYMPPQQRAFIATLTSLAEEVEWTASPLQAAHRAAAEALQDLRQAHLNLVAHYIIQPAKQSGASTQGTGGTDALRFLKQLRDETA